MSFPILEKPFQEMDTLLMELETIGHNNIVKIKEKWVEASGTSGKSAWIKQEAGKKQDRNPAYEDICIMVQWWWKYTTKTWSFWLIVVDESTEVD